VRFPKEKIHDQCGVFIPGNDNGDTLLEGGRRCEQPAEIVIPFLGTIGGLGVCLDCAAMIARELQKDLA
jgi:hypothetical protein